MIPQTAGPAEPALAALGALLDRSLVQICDAARDARTFDRETIRAVSDVWDNGTIPLFRAATGRSGPERERRARAALEWMARLRPQRWDWMVEQAAVSGHPIDALVRPVPARLDEPYRDYRGAVRPVYSRLTPQTVTDLAGDYALEAATVRHLRIERAGTRLGGFLTLELVRSYDLDEHTTPVPPTLHVYLDDLAEVDLDTGTAAGVRLVFEAQGVLVGLGTRGVLRARAASLILDDRSWHLSRAGRRADARVPPRQGGVRPDHRPREGKLEGFTRGAATFLVGAMMMIRSVRYPREVARVPLEAYYRALQGAGHDVLVAGALPQRGREAAFRSLVTQWLRRGGTDLVPDWSLLLRDVPDASRIAGAVRDDLLPRAAVPPTRVLAGEVTGFPGQVELRMVSYTAQDTESRSPREASAMVHLAVPSDEEGAPWRMRVLNAADPVRLRALTEAFNGAGRVRMDRDTGERETFVVGDGALSLSAHTWRQAPSLD